MATTSSSPSSTSARRNLRIGLVADYLPPGRLGGVGEVVAALRDAYRALGAEVSVLTAGQRPDDDGGAAEREEGVRRVGSGPLALGAASFLPPDELRGLDVLHIHQASAPGLYLRRGALGDPRPALITTIHASAGEEMRQVRPRRLPTGESVRPRLGEYLYRYITGPLHAAADRLAVRSSDAVTAVSDGPLEECRLGGVLPPGGLWKIPNGVDADRFRPGAGGDRLRAEMGLEGGFLVLYAGTFRLRKGVHELLVALRDLRATVPDARLLLVGGGRGYERGLRRMARSLGVAEAITFAGPREHDELPPFYDAADAVALPSLFEGLPLVLLEAMAAARPVVATAVGGIPDLVEDGRTGRLVAPGDPAALAAALAGVAADPEAARRLGAAARERVVEGNSWEAIARRYLHVIGRSTADRIDGPPREKVS